MRALHLYAGQTARAWLARNGLQAQDVGTIPAAAGGPKGLLLGPLDRFLFGDWLARSTHTVDLVGASIGAWRMATACLAQPQLGFARLDHDYIHQHYELAPGQKRPSAQQVSDTFGRNLEDFFGSHLEQVLQHPRYRLHIVTSRGRHLLRREHRWATPLGYAGAFVSNAVRRKSLGAWLERVVFSSQQAALPFGTHDFATRQVALSAANFNPALQASCSIPFVLQAVHDIPGAPSGAYWDGGITDYHLRLDYPSKKPQSIVLYPHFQAQVVPGWLDKSLAWRHRATPFLDTMLLLAPNPEWVKTLPNGKLPDRHDFVFYGKDLAARVRAWSAAVSASAQLAQEFAAWLERPDMSLVQSLTPARAG